MLRLTNLGRDGFILTDFPKDVRDAEILEEYRGGVNSFVHLSLPDDVQVAIEETKISCNDCGRNYYPENIVNEEQQIIIEPFIPKDGHCYDCGSQEFIKAGNAANFEIF